MQEIKTPRLHLINADPEIIHHLWLGDDALAAYLNVNIPTPWTEFGTAPFQYVLSRITEEPASMPWWSWMPIYEAENMLIGNSGYKGMPADGVVEIGYEVAEAYRGKGFATEIAKALVE